MEQFIRECCEGLDVNLSYDMPEGYEEAYGTFDVCCNTLFLNKKRLAKDPPYRTAFFLFHELRHAWQYKRTDQFPDEIRESIPYVILYNGICYRLQGNVGKMCKLSGDEAYFTGLYLSLPYELDANCYAYEKAVELYPDNKTEVEKLYRFFMPNPIASKEELEKTFRLIDECV